MPRGGARQPAIPGQKFGYWTVVEDGKSGLWLCECECGTRIERPIISLVRGTSKSCGCHGKDWCTSHGQEGTPVYIMWSGMIQRCENPNSGSYGRYGAKGIRVCPEWRVSFEAFQRDMGLFPGKGYSIGRRDGTLGYGPDNCQWETVTEQNRNRSNTVFLEHDGRRLPLAEWAEIYKIGRRQLAERMRTGWSVERALMTPVAYKASRERFWKAHARRQQSC